MSIANYASDILEKNGIDNISFKRTTQASILKNGLKFSDLFVSIASFDQLGGRSEGYADVNPNTGITDAYGEGEDPTSFYYIKTYVNFEAQIIQTHPNPLYATGYLVAHEILHQLNDKAAFIKTGSIVPNTDVHTTGLNKIGSGVTIPKGPLNGNGRGALNEAERIPMLQLIMIKKYFLQTKP